MTPQTINHDKLNSFVGRVFEDIAGSYGALMASLGHRLGLYKAMQGAGPISARELAARSECEERYVAEWLRSQAAGGYLTYHPLSDSFELTPEHALVLADESSPAFMSIAVQLPGPLWAGQDKLVEAFRSGEGVSWGEHDERLHAGVAAFYRNGYKANLVSQWLPALDGVVDRLQAGISVADIGCGYGHSTILMAEAFPKSRFHGFDVHTASVAAARANAGQSDTRASTSFDVATATSYPGKYDLICFFDALHDMGDPVAAAQHAAQALKPGGTVMLVEPFANDRLEDNVNVVGKVYYGGSTMLCVPHAISEGGYSALGAQAGETRLAEVLRKAGFSSFRRAAESPFNLILEARIG